MVCLKMRQTKVLGTSQVYSEHQTIYTLKVKKSPEWRVQSQQQATCGKTMFFPIGHMNNNRWGKSITPQKSMETYFKNNSIFKTLRSQDFCLDLLEFSHKYSEFSMTPFLNCVLTVCALLFPVCVLHGGLSELGGWVCASPPNYLVCISRHFYCL